MEIAPGRGDQPLITTVIPTFRRPRLLRRALKSVLNQTYPHFRVCIYDNASGDETAQVVTQTAQGDPRVQYHCHSQNIGMSKNFVYGQERVETPYFSFLSDDDVLLPNFYQDALEGFRKFPEAAFSALGIVLMNADEELGNMALEAWPEGLCRPPESFRKMLTMYPPLWTAILFRGELRESVGLLDVEAGYGFDIDYELRVAAHHPFVFSPRPGALGVVHAEAQTVQSPWEAFWPGIMKIARNLAEDQSLDPELRSFAAQAMTRLTKHKLFVDMGLRAIIRGRADDARRSAEILSQEFGEAGRARFLRFCAALCGILPPLRQVLAGALSVRRHVQNSRRKALVQQQMHHYREYASYLSLG